MQQGLFGIECLPDLFRLVPGNLLQPSMDRRHVAAIVEPSLV